jgi:hypothetical protein
MRRREHYRRMALQCLEEAGGVSDLHERQALLKIADAWIQLADYVRRLPDRPTRGTENGSRHEAGASNGRGADN